MWTRDAPLVWNQLRGLICVYKPADMSTTHVRQVIMHKICTDLNELNVRPPIDYVSIEPGSDSTEYKVTVQPSLADDPMVVGPRYQPKDLICSWSNHLGWNTSGVLLLGLKRGTTLAKTIRENFPTRAYRVKGTFGRATENFYKSGKVVERSTYKHVRSEHVEKLLANMQAAHQRKMFELCGVDMQTQAAYDLAKQGPIRPASSKLPIIYGIKCVEFNPPDFTLEIQCVNEYEMYLKTLVHEIGVKLHSTAHCTGVQCIRHSHFNLDHALLRKHWDLRRILNNLQTCRKMIEEHDTLIRQESVALR